MKLCKKKMAILATVCALMFVLVFVFCSFAPPVYTLTQIELNRKVNSSEAEILFNIVNLQAACGQFNNFYPIFLIHNGYTNDPMLIVARADSQWSYTLSSGNYTLNSAGGLYSVFLTSQGFSIYNNLGSISFTESNIIALRRNTASYFNLNPNYSPGSSTTDDDQIIDIYNYWIEFHERISSDMVGEVESAYNKGYTDGYLTGNADGYRNGYDEGVDYGYNVGYPAGYDSGLADGYETGFADGLETGYRNGYEQGDIDGYDSGYDEGYSEGYSEGYEEADRETVTVIEYVEPVEISVGSIISGISSVPDNILNGTFDFELFGINVYGLLKVIIILFVISAVVVFVIKRSA